MCLRSAFLASYSLKCTNEQNIIFIDSSLFHWFPSRFFFFSQLDMGLRNGTLKNRRNISVFIFHLIQFHTAIVNFLWHDKRSWEVLDLLNLKLLRMKNGFANIVNERNVWYRMEKKGLRVMVKLTQAIGFIWDFFRFTFRFARIIFSRGWWKMDKGYFLEINYLYKLKTCREIFLK